MPQITRLDGRQHLGDLRHQGSQGLQTRVGRDEHHDPEHHRAQVLLVLHVLIGGNEHLKTGLSQTQQCAVLGAGSSHLRHGSDVMDGQLVLQPARQALI
jgi:hypothetical protein